MRNWSDSSSPRQWARRAGKEQGQNEPDGSPEQGLLEFDDAGEAVEDAQVQRQKNQDDEDKPRPVPRP